MEYIIIGLLMSIGWQIARVIFEVVEELLFTRLHNADWYLIAAGQKTAVSNNKPGDIKPVKNQIGFHYTEEAES